VLPSEPSSVRTVRGRLAEVLQGAPECTVDDVLLAASEVITNAVVHGEGPMAVRVWPNADVVRLEVTDNGRAHPCANLDPTQDEENGRGLLIVDVLTSRWGVAPADPGPGKTLWFEIDQRAADPDEDCRRP
jgi:anti-sigma regulatory factor (Ser/Thr protein kinase)